MACSAAVWMGWAVECGDEYLRGAALAQLARYRASDAQVGARHTALSTRKIGLQRSPIKHWELSKQKRITTQAERSDGPFGSPHPSGRAEKHSGRGARGHRRMSTLRDLTRRSCLSGAAQQQSEFCGGTPLASIAGCPVAQRREYGKWDRLSFAYFSLAKQRKVGRPPGRDPASSAPNTTPTNNQIGHQRPTTKRHQLSIQKQAQL